MKSCGHSYSDGFCTGASIGAPNPRAVSRRLLVYQQPASTLKLLRRKIIAACMGCQVKLPGAVRETLCALFGTAVDDVRIVERSWFARAHGRALATTRHRRIYLRGSAEDFFADPAMVLHEYFHVLGQWEPGDLSVWRYVLEWFRKGYWDNRFEIEAREFATDQYHRYCALLARHAAAEGLRHA